MYFTVPALPDGSTRLRCRAVGGNGTLGANAHCLGAHEKETLEDELFDLGSRPQACVAKGFQ